MANSLVPQLDVRLSFETFGIHGRFHLLRIESNEHSAFSPSPSYELANFFNKASFVVELYLHALLHDLADRDQILSDCRNLKNILDAIIFVVFAE